MFQIENGAVRFPERDRSERMDRTVGHRPVGGPVESRVRPVQDPKHRAVRDPVHVAEPAAERGVLLRRPHGRAVEPGRLPERVVRVPDRGERHHVQDRFEARERERRAASDLRAEVRGSRRRRFEHFNRSRRVLGTLKIMDYYYAILKRVLGAAK